MAGAKNHDYHILPPDIWPLIGAISALVLVLSLSHLQIRGLLVRIAVTSIGCFLILLGYANSMLVALPIVIVVAVVLSMKGDKDKDKNDGNGKAE
mgnify:CR=1 FL=1